MRLERRGFLKGMGAVGGLGAGGVGWQVAQAATEARAKGPAAKAPEVKKIKSACSICPNFCGIEATVVNGVVRTIYPDAARAEYYNHGICPKGASGMFNTYDPYRLKKPLRRTNPNKGPDQNPGWVEISWDEAFGLINTRLDTLRKSNPRGLVVQYGQGKYLIQEHFPRAFCDAFGTPNFVHRTTVCEAARHVADDTTWGYHGNVPDMTHCTFLLNFGANYHEGEQHSRWLDWTSANGREKGTLRTVVVEPRLSGCAAKADEWVPMRPGKDVVMILAMARLLIQAGTVDEPFLTTYTNAPQLVGADGRILLDKDGKTPLVWDTASSSAKAFVEGVKPALKGAYTVEGKAYRTAFQVLAEHVAEITPAYAEEVCGVPAATIERLAKSFAQAAHIGETKEIDGVKYRYRPAVAYTWRGLAAKEFGVQNSRSALILNMLVGSIDAVGGLRLSNVYRSPSYMEEAKCEYPPTRADLKYSVFHPNSHHDICQQPNLSALDPAAVGLPYAVEAQIFYATNRPMSTSEPWKQFEGMKKTWNVVIDVVLSETAHYADIVLPDKTYLESWHFAPTRGVPDASHMAIRQPMTNPFNLQHDAYSIFYELAKRMGARDKYLEACNKRWELKEVKFEPGRDYDARQAVEVIWADKTKKDFSVATEQGFVGKKNDAKAKYAGGIEAKFKGPGKPKMKLYADQFIATYEKVEKTAKANKLASIDLPKYKVAYLPLPSKEHAFPTPHREAKDYPFYLVTHKSMYRNQTGLTVNNPILNKALGADANTNYVSINTAAAARLGISTGDVVVIESRVGKTKGVAKVVEGIRPDTVAVSFHFGQWSPGYADFGRKGTWINQVLELHPDIPSGMNSFNDTKCKIYKA